MNSPRTDRKYVVPAAVIERILGESADIVSIETHGGLSHQRYVTDYFDTRDLELFHAARGKRPERCKVRVRHYLDTGESFLEVKRRSQRGQITKARLPWTGVLGAAREFLVGELGPYTPVIDRLTCTAQTSYERDAYAVSGEGRITVDTNLRFGRDGEFTHRLFADGSDVVIVETKADRQFCTRIDHALWDLHVRPQPLSKYALAIASVRPDLSLNRWANVAALLQRTDMPLLQRTDMH